MNANFNHQQTPEHGFLQEATEPTKGLPNKGGYPFPRKPTIHYFTESAIHRRYLRLPESRRRAMNSGVS